MAKEIAVENGRISNFEGLVTLTLDRVILHTAVRQSLTTTIPTLCYTYMPNFIAIEDTFVDGRTHARTDI